ncbi:hypothetical protein CYMTET_20326 [Cymbomonas tetramitiformis]|uniref:Uncharacterized protein n=1 Tax=Cymbomonas tetramitiformis TaxID=36881 RepID=A0AAE0G4H4_9CHLO|nr:hypothetical protein CYMTET_20326 [Cymbomonas tetramitiformis]
MGKHETISQEGVRSASDTWAWAPRRQRVYAIPHSLLHHLFCELKLGERMNEESALAVMDLISVLTAEMDEHAVELQDTDAC